MTVTLTLSGDAGATLAVPVSANLPTGHADYTPTGVTFPVTTGSGATLDISVAAVDDNLVEASLESFPSQLLSVSSTATSSASGARTVEVTDDESASVAIVAGTTAVTEGGSRPW